VSTDKKPNEIADYLKAEHDALLTELGGVEEVLRAHPHDGETVKVLEKFVDVLERYEEHFVDERDIVFPELDKLPRKQPLKLANLEHDDLVRIYSVLRTHIETAMKYKDEPHLSSTTQTAMKLIEFTKRHFKLEEELILPMCENLNEEQQTKIMRQLGS
jgi:hemerythrin-like domain-containing protein